MWWNVGPHLKRRMAYERGETGKCRETHTFFNGESGVDDFTEILKRKYGTLTRAWRIALDSDNSGLLDAREFVAAMSVIGFSGNIRSLWYNLDRDQSGYISLAELDSEAADALEKFRACCVKAFGSMDAAWKMCLDKDNSGALTLPELEEACGELGYTDMDEVAELFNLLRLEPSAFRVKDFEVMFLQVWEERKQQHMFRLWRKGARWVNKDPYLSEDETADGPLSSELRKSMFTFTVPKATTPLGTTPDPDGRRLPPFQSPAPQQRLNSKSVPAGAAGYARRPKCRSVTPQQSARDVNTPGSDVAVSNGDTKSQLSDWTDIVAIDKDKAWIDFETYLITSFGSLVSAFDTMDTSGDGSIEREEWMNMVTRKLRYCRASEALRLFDSRVVNGDYITYQNLGITNQEWILYNHEKRTKSQHMVNRNVQMKPVAFGGQGMRWKLANQVHEIRMKCKPKKPAEAFWTTLPSGWGFPPSYTDMRTVAAEKSRNWSGKFGPLSARGAEEPAFTALTADSPAEGNAEKPPAPPDLSARRASRQAQSQARRQSMGLVAIPAMLSAR